MTDQRPIFGCTKCETTRSYGTVRPDSIAGLSPWLVCAHCRHMTMHKFIGMVWERPDRYSARLGE